MFRNADRTIHLIDIENLCGLGRPSAQQVAQVRRAYQALIPLRKGDHVVLGCNHGALLEVGLGWGTGPRIVVGSGPDGADHALIGALEESRRCNFKRIFIGSGDAIFSDIAASWGSVGVDVFAVSRPTALSARLRMATIGFALLPSLPAAMEVA